MTKSSTKAYVLRPVKSCATCNWQENLLLGGRRGWLWRPKAKYGDVYKIGRCSWDVKGIFMGFHVISLGDFVGFHGI
jgi:hypothetical protein